MAKEIEDTRRKADKKPKRKVSEEGVMVETILGVFAVLTVLFAVLVVLAFAHQAGTGGDLTLEFLVHVFGVYGYVTPVIALGLAYYLWKASAPPVSVRAVVGFGIFYLATSTLLAVVGPEQFLGGVVGSYIVGITSSTFGPIVTSIGSILISFAGLMIVRDSKPSLHSPIHLVASPFQKLAGLFTRKEAPGDDLDDVPIPEDDDYEEGEDIIETDAPYDEESDDEEELPRSSNIRSKVPGLLTIPDDEPKARRSPRQKPVAQEDDEMPKQATLLTPTFTPPPLDILNPDQGRSGAGDSKSKMLTIQRTLEHFKIRVEMSEVTVGPSVTQFTLKPAQGVNLSKIVQLHDNLAMELGAENLRIEAPIPGKTLVGIEIPNERKTTLGLRSMLELSEFKDSGPLTVAIGKSIIGKPIFGDLEKMPHLLVAGATRAGKSVTIQNLLISLLYKNSPYDLKLIILDPKRVDFQPYKKLPHLYTPVINEPKSAIKALNWAIQEMDRRYEILAENGQVNLSDYNKKVLVPAMEKARKKNKTGDEVEGLPPKLPYIVIVFDEYNEFMLSYPKEITPLITSLTQKGRAAGIHLILATQRPDTKVITGTIKANIPARIALKTTSQIDSRTILDAGGAEDLLGNGDLLLMTPENSRLVRIQAPYVTPEEIKAVVNYITEAHYDYDQESNQIDISKVNTASGSNARTTDGEDVSDEDQEDFEKAREFIIATGKASTSSLQTNLRWGYNKASRIMQQLADAGIISEQTAPGSKFREILSFEGHTDEEESDED